MDNSDGGVANNCFKKATQPLVGGLVDQRSAQGSRNQRARSSQGIRDVERAEIELIKYYERCRGLRGVPRAACMRGGEACGGVRYAYARRIVREPHTPWRMAGICRLSGQASGAAACCVRAISARAA